MLSHCKGAIGLVCLGLTVPLVRNAPALTMERSASPSLRDIRSFRTSYLSQLGSNATRAQGLRLVTPFPASCAQAAVRNSKGFVSELIGRCIAITKVIGIKVAGSGHAIIAVQ